jgi:hypothetical protein
MRQPGFVLGGQPRPRFRALMADGVVIRIAGSRTGYGGLGGLLPVVPASGSCSGSLRGSVSRISRLGSRCA